MVSGMDALSTGDLETAARLFREAAEAGIAEAWLMLSDVHFQKGNDEASREAFLRAKEMADNGDSHANLVLSHAYNMLMGTEPDDEQVDLARKYLKKAAELDSFEAKYILKSKSARK
jgi:TPR repeat protein